MIRYFLLASVIAVATATQIIPQRSDFVSVKAQTFQLNNKPYHFIGANYWFGSLLGLEKDKRRGIERLKKELDFLKRNGVTNLRLMAGAEGTGVINGVMRVGPALQTEQGKFDEHALDGLDLILAEMTKRKMTAVIFLSNNWEWTGGFQQYVDWNGLVPDELNGRPLNWDELRDIGARFYVCAECKTAYLKQVRLVMERTNKITGRKYTNDRTIMAWELANEPRPMRPGARERYAEWIRDAAAAIKARDKNHLVTTGHEGSVGTEGMELFEEVHRDVNIDYLTIHIWPKNWGWLENAVEKSVEYIEQHIMVARRLNKPLVIEEFGLPRDAFLAKLRTLEENHPGGDAPPPLLRKEGSVTADQFKSGSEFEPGSPTTRRNEYFRKIFSYVGKGPVAGANFWAFGGIARPVNGQTYWKAGDAWMGDPPMEEQGLNSVFDVDRSTWKVIQSVSRSIRR
jgi:mannan endo-1,4-beta-mannosidase